MTKLTTEQLEIIRTRAENATEGPWRIYEKDGGRGIGTSWDHPQLRGPLPVVTIGIHFEEPSQKPQHSVYINEDDADFIVNSREDVPKLLAEISRLKEDMSEIAEIVSDFYTEQGGVRLPKSLTSVAGEIRVIHKLALGGAI